MSCRSSAADNHDTLAIQIELHGKPMTGENLGNQMYRIVSDAKANLFEQGELAQLTYGAFDIAARAMDDSDQEEIRVTFPVGWRADNQPIQSTRTYKKDQLRGRYQFLAFQQLSINGLVQLVTIMEAMFGDVVRAVVMKYPKKIGAKRTVPLQTVLEAGSITEVQLRAADTFLNELAYKSPSEFAESLQALMAVNLLECPAFHRYIEMKASRDIFIHNRGVASDIYVRKAGTHLRVQAGMNLPADIHYFMQSYEACLQVTEWLESELHQHWHSSHYEERQSKQLQIPMSEAEERSEDGPNV